MQHLGKQEAWIWFAAGVVLATFIGSALLWFADYSLVARQSLAKQQARLAKLETENLELTEDLFRSRGLLEPSFNGDDLPYDERADAVSAVAEARKLALKEGRFLMVTFGANWCIDCRILHRRLQSTDVAAYTRDLFHFVNVNVGKFNQNREVAEKLGVDLRRGIPVAVFFDPQGRPIGTTNNGQLEPARRYSSKQILKFVRDVAERSLILAPDSVQ